MSDFEIKCSATNALFCDLNLKDGATGSTGPKGIKGEDGDQGDQGVVGITGAIGMTQVRFGTASIGDNGGNVVVNLGAALSNSNYSVSLMVTSGSGGTDLEPSKYPDGLVGGGSTFGSTPEHANILLVHSKTPSQFTVKVYDGYNSNKQSAHEGVNFDWIVYY